MNSIFNYFADTYDLAWLALNCAYSVKRVLMGVMAAVIIGITAGLLRSALPRNFKNNRVLRFLFEAPKFPPPIAWIPFVILFFGIGEISAYTIVFIGAFSPIFTNTYDGAESVSRITQNTARSMEIYGIRYLFYIIFQASLPQILTGVRIGISMGWMSVIAAEMISGQSGLGYSIQLNRLNLQYDLMVVDMLLIGFIGFLLFEGAVLFEKKIIPWRG
jgi:ABC-type nitrate/sulfonate/bicarbonate transport system permease component